jgi:hypothetical protein
MEDKMERTVALNKIRKLLGKEYSYQINPKAPTPEEREAAKAALPAARELHKALDDKKQARLEALLKGDAEYQALREQTTVALRNRNDLSGTLHAYKKITVGNTVGGMFFSVKAVGDSWEEVIAKLTKAKVCN